LLFNVSWLIAHGNFRDARQIHQSEIEHMRRVDLLLRREEEIRRKKRTQATNNKEEKLLRAFSRWPP